MSALLRPQPFGGSSYMDTAPFVAEWRARRDWRQAERRIERLWFLLAFGVLIWIVAAAFQGLASPA